MMTLRRLWFPTITLLVLFTPAPPAHAQERTKEFTVEDIYASRKFSSDRFRSMRWIEKGRASSYLETDSTTKATDIWRYDIGDGSTGKLVAGTDLKLPGAAEPIDVKNYIFSPDEKKILFTGTLTARSLKTGGNFYLWDREKKALTQLTDTEDPQINVKFSPDGLKIGFVRNDNLFVLDLETGHETQLTVDGGAHVLNGHFDWVYEEEFGIIDGWQWSPDSRRIAFWQLDEERVPEFPIIDFLPLHQKTETMRYPKAGDPNSIVRIGVVGVQTEAAATDHGPGRSVRWLDIGAPADSNQDVYIPRIGWTKDPVTLSVQRLNRLQDTLDLMLFDVVTGASRVILTETSATWVEVRDDLQFMEKSKTFLWSSERDGYRHLYLYDLDGGLLRQLTKGGWDVDNVAGADEGNGVVYFTAGVSSPMDRDLFSVKLDGTGFRQITKEPGSHSVNFSPDFSTYRESYSDANTPTRTALFRSDGTLIRVLSDGRIAALDEYVISPKTFFSFTTSDGVALNGWMIKPHDFDPMKKYPVLMYVYGGPGSQTVRNSWGGADYFWYQMLAQKGYAIASVDNRGTGARGRAFKNVTYKNLGKWETNDQVEAARYLAGLSYVDSSRIGIWGWSYGGYMTLMAMTVGADVFSAGVSVAPVSNWKFYDTIYTERYMQTPSLNPDGYAASAPTGHAGELKGKLLEIHGTADDNVHWQNTVTMVGELIKAGKQFETAFYPGGRHGIAGGEARAQLFTKITNFILTNL